MKKKEKESWTIINSNVSYNMELTHTANNAPRNLKSSYYKGLHMRAHAKVNKNTSSAEQGTCKHSQKFWHRDWEFWWIPASACFSEMVSYMTSCFTFLVRDQMLDNDVSHVVSVGVPILVQTMDSTEDQLIVRDRPVLTPHRLYN